MPELHSMPRCAMLVQYGGGDAFRSSELLLALPLDPVVAVGPGLKRSIEEAINAALAQRNAGAYESLTSEHISASWDRGSLSIDAALAVTTSMPDGWANLYFHGWLFEGLLESDAQVYAAQRFPLIGAKDRSVWHE